MYRGKKDYRDTGRVISFNGDAGKQFTPFSILGRHFHDISIVSLHDLKFIEMDYYDGEECNTFVGTDSTIFPAFLPLDEGIFVGKNFETFSVLEILCLIFNFSFRSRCFCIRTNSLPSARCNIQV